MSDAVTGCFALTFAALLYAGLLAWLAKRNGRATILDPTGSGDARKFWQLLGRDPGWADAAELRREFSKLDCDLGKYMRQIQQTLGEAA